MLWQQTGMPRGVVSVRGDRILSEGTELFDPNGRVFCVNALTGEQTRIGTVHDPIGTCAADQRVLVCPTEDGLMAWRIA